MRTPQRRDEGFIVKEDPWKLRPRDVVRIARAGVAPLNAEPSALQNHWTEAPSSRGSSGRVLERRDLTMG